MFSQKIRLDELFFFDNNPSVAPKESRHWDLLHRKCSSVPDTCANASKAKLEVNRNNTFRSVMSTDDVREYYFY